MERRKMKIIKNTSKFDTKKLRSLFSYVHNLIAKTEGRLPQWNGLQVQVRQKSYGTSGQAYVGKVYGSGWDMFLSISEKVILKDIVNLFSHELMHSYGFHHRNMLKHYPLTEQQHQKIKDKFGNVDLNKVEKPKAKIDYVALRKERAEVNLSIWESKFNFAKNKVKKYKRQVVYYRNK
tara:strand:- start:116 stop:649 length:534 start_codon:yes stop_codon:yes gene_type:complete